MKMNQFRQILNFRDLGGTKTKSGKTIKPNLFYRSGGLYLLNDAEKEEFRKLGIKAIVELRTKPEWEKRPDPVFEGVKNLQYDGHELNIGHTIDFSAQGMAQTGEKGIRQFELLRQYYDLLPYDNDAYKLLFEQIRKEELPVLFHCFSGKDRTGNAAMLIMALLEVDLEEIAKDFMLSNEYYEKDIEFNLSNSEIDLKEHPETARLITMTYGVDEEIIRSSYHNVLKTSGSFEDYFMKEYGYTLEDIERIRKNCTE